MYKLCFSIFYEYVCANKLSIYYIEYIIYILYILYIIYIYIYTQQYPDAPCMLLLRLKLSASPILSEAQKHHTKRMVLRE